jgi:hypothetical protein
LVISLKGKNTDRQRVLGKRMFRRIFRLKREEVIRKWRKLHNEKLQYLYFSHSSYLSDQIKTVVMRAARGRRRMQEKCT